MNEGQKIVNLDEFLQIRQRLREEQKVLVQCHGVFDLLHPGHIKHLQEAKEQGDVLLVTLTADEYVNKGPDRPYFKQNLRLETISAMQCVDYVLLSQSPDAVSLIEKIQPNLFVKGIEYKSHDQDITGKISLENDAVIKGGGKIYYTDDIVFSSSELLNKYFHQISLPVREFLAELRSEFPPQTMMEAINQLGDLNVLVVGDAIIDEYQYVNPLGQSGKGHHMVAETKNKDTFLGGSLIIANHVANFAKQVTLLTAVSEDDDYFNFIEQNLAKNVKKEFILIKDKGSLVKKRYVHKDGKTLNKLFETYSRNDSMLSEEQSQRVIDFIEQKADSFDMVLVCDFGNGFTNRSIMRALSVTKNFLALNTQSNSGNRGYKVVTHYSRADFISINEPELRLTAHEKSADVKDLMKPVAEVLACDKIAVTQGVDGLILYEKDLGFNRIPALTQNVVDRVGAGDAFLSLASLCLAKGLPFKLSAFIGSLAAAMDTQIVGNQAAIDKISLCKFITTILK